MRTLHLLTTIAVIAVGLAMTPSAGLPDDPECIIVWCQFDQQTDPPCEPLANRAVRFTSTPTSTSAGSCSNFNLDYAHTGVDLFDDCDTPQLLCTDTCCASDANLSGMYEVLEVSGNCFKICELCP